MMPFPKRFFPALAILTLAGAGCFSGPEPAPPREALAAASAEIDAVLAEFEPESVEIPQKTGDASTVQVWTYQHPLVSPALTASGLARFHRGPSGVRIAHQPLGDWRHAVQKLTVHIVGGGLPDIALVRRDWAASLMHTARLADLEPLLGEEFLRGLAGDPRLEQVRVAGALRALPADCFVTALYYWPEFVDSPPRDWAELRARARAMRGADVEAPIGAFPYLDALGAAGGALVREGKSAVDGEAGVEALRLLLELRDEGLGHPRALRNPALGLDLFRRKAAAMTVASSRHWPELRGQGAAVVAVPGRQGPAARLENDVLVVFAGGQARPEALGEVLRYLAAGPHADHAGNLTPFLEAAEREAPVPAALREARLFAPPPVPRLSRVEGVVHEAVDRAWRFGR